MNKVFGGLGDFVQFFSRRNSEMRDFAYRFEKIEEFYDLDRLHHNIIPEVIFCLEELVKPIIEQLSDSSISRIQKKRIKSHEELVSLFKEESRSFEEFYGRILRAYTMNTCLYEKLNYCLRNESWVEIDSLLPYAFCLCKAFFYFHLQTDPSQENEESKIETEQQKPRSILLYRGTAFDDGALRFYKDPQTSQQHFSWNSVTSASTNVEVAKKFMYDNVDLMNKKYPVLFLIEIPIPQDGYESDYLKWIDVRQHSAKKEEDEVILAPGSVFEVVKASTDKDQRNKIWLKMNHKVQSLAHRGLIMQGALQKKMMTENEVKIACLEGEELIDALKCLAGNKLIDEVEFCMCIFDQRSLIAMMETLSTLERAKELKLISCEYSDQEKLSSGFLKQFKKCNISKVEISGSSDFDELLSVQTEDNMKWISLRELKTTFIGRENDSDGGGINDKIFQRFRHFNQLRSLTLDFFLSSIVFNPKNIHLIFYEIRHLTQLTSLTVSFKYNEEITDEGVHRLAFHGLRHLIQLRSLALNFDECCEITDKGMKSLVSEGLRNLAQLTSLDLNFDSCEKITDEGVSSLAFHGLQNLTQLASLTMRFYFCQQITDVGVHSISQGLQYLTELTSLTLDFGELTITNEGLKSLAQGLRNLNKLISLVLDLFYSENIANKGVRSLVFQWLRHLIKLRHLSLNFGYCDSVTDLEVRNLAFEGLRYLTKLTSLTLNFKGCSKITNKGMRNLASQGLRFLLQLTSLTLHFTECEGITDEGKGNFLDQILIYLSHLKWDFRSFDQLHFESNANEDNPQTQQTPQSSERNQLTLRRVFDKQKQLTSEEESSTSTFQNVKVETQVCPSSFESSKELEIYLRKDFVEAGCSLPEQILSLPLHLNSTLRMTNVSHKLTSLTLNCSGYKEITDEEVSSLCRKLREMTQLASLALDLSFCANITDKGVQSLAFEGLQSLTQLTSLTIKFRGCDKITDKGVKNLASEGLQHLTQLTSLTIKFSWCRNLTDEGIQSLASKGLQNLTQLASLSLKLSHCNNLTDEGIRSLASQGFKYLTKLTSLTLDFTDYYRLIDKGVHNLAFHGLRYLTKLTSLTLSFDRCYSLRDEGVRSLASQGFQYLTKLTSLTLNFWACEITDEGMQSLVFQGLRNLTQLTSLTLKLGGCKEITDKGVHILAFQGLKHMTQLSSLSLQFAYCDKVTDFMFANLSKVLHYLGFVEDSEIDEDDI